MAISTPVLLGSNFNINTGTADTITAGNNSPNGALIIAAGLSWGNNNTIFSGFSDSVNGAYTNINHSGISAGGANGTGESSLWYFNNAAPLISGSTTVTMTANSGSLGYIIMYVTGAASSPIDAAGNVTYAASTSSTSGTMPTTGTLANSGDLLVWAGSNAPTNWVGLAASDAAGSLSVVRNVSGIAMLYQFPGTTTAQSVGFSWTSAAFVTAAMVAIKPPGAAGGLRFNSNLDGLGASGGFFRDPLGY